MFIPVQTITPAIKQLNRSGEQYDNHRKNSKLTGWAFKYFTV